MVGLHAADGARGRGAVVVDVVRGEEILAVARREELLVEGTIRVRGDGRDELGFLALGRLDQGRDGGGGLGAAHHGRQAHVGEVGLVEGQHPFGRAV